MLTEHGDPASEFVWKRSHLLAMRRIQEGLRRQLDDAQRLIDFMGNGGGFKADLQLVAHQRQGLLFFFSQLLGPLIEGRHHGLDGGIEIDQFLSAVLVHLTGVVEDVSLGIIDASDLSLRVLTGVTQGGQRFQNPLDQASIDDQRAGHGSNTDADGNAQIAIGLVDGAVSADCGEQHPIEVVFASPWRRLQHERVAVEIVQLGFGAERGCPP